MKPENKLSVSAIVWEVFPFDNDAKDMFKNALSKEGIDRKRMKWEITSWSIADIAGGLRYDGVMDTLCTLGTIVHSSAFDLGTLGFCSTFEGTLYEPHVKSVMDFFETTWARTVAWEVFMETEDYYGISDGILNIGWRNILVDFKSWTAYKYIYGISNKILKKDGTPYAQTDNVKKVSLQLSLYKAGLVDRFQIDGMMVIWFTEQGWFTFDCIDDLTPYHEWKASKLKTNNWITIWRSK